MNLFCHALKLCCYQNSHDTNIVTIQAPDLLFVLSEIKKKKQNRREEKGDHGQIKKMEVWEPCEQKFPKV